MMTYRVSNLEFPSPYGEDKGFILAVYSIRKGVMKFPSPYGEDKGFIERPNV